MTTAAKFGEKTLTDGEAAEGSLISNISVSIGESSFCEAELGDEATSGRTNTNGSPKTWMMKEPGELMALKTSDSAENVSLCKLKVEDPTLKPVCAHIFVAAVVVTVSVSAFLPACTGPTGALVDRDARTHRVSMPSATLRFRVSATSTFSSPPVGTGGVSKVGASAKGLNHSEMSLKAKMAAPDKIGISIKGAP